MWHELTEGWPAVLFVVYCLGLVSVPVAIVLWRCRRHVKKRYVVVYSDKSRSEPLPIEKALNVAKLARGSHVQPAFPSELKPGEETSVDDEDCNL